MPAQALVANEQVDRGVEAAERLPEDLGATRRKSPGGEVAPWGMLDGFTRSAPAPGAVLSWLADARSAISVDGRR